jgi:spermidine synthase
MNSFLFYTLIFLSGCSGLIYEVVWHRYLAILLGAQARATAIVLAIFLGGISVGYATFGRWSRYKRWNLFKAYAMVELGLGLWAMLFPLLFRGALPTTAVLYGVFGVNSLLIDIFVAVVLIGFPTFLMGGTLPLLTQALSKDLKGASQTHARIYGTNTLGACFGCLLAGYVLIPNSGLQVATWVGGVFNLITCVVVVAYFARRYQPRDDDEAPSRKKERWFISRAHLPLFAIGFLSGFYLLTLQTVIIRLVGLSTGASNYTFTLIVSLFIFGLGFGALRVKQIGTYTVGRLFWNQVALSAFLFWVYLSGDNWSYWVHLIRISLRDAVENFYLYQFLLGLLFASLLLLPLGLAGVTLPLCFHLIKDRSDTLGHRVGQLYSLNSLGCVLGALVGGYGLFYFLNLDQVFKLCVLLSLSTVALAAWPYLKKKSRRKYKLGATGVACVAAVVVVFFAPLYTKERFIQPFRHPQPIKDVSYSGAEAWGNYLARSTQYVLYKDGPNTSVGIGAAKFEGKELSRTIFVNGKSDGNTRGDYFTTVMLAHLPGLLSKSPTNVCVIGFGTGTTIGTLELYPQIESIDVADISGTILENKAEFDKYNGGVSTNSKAHFHEMDAFRFLQGTDKPFDVIVSEPSNPWVSGIENLYSYEFYKMARERLGDSGMFVQWIHTYSFSDDLMRMVLKTMSYHFPYVSVFQLKGGDFALVGTQKNFDRGDLLRAERRMDNPKIHAALAEAGVDRFETVLALEMIPHSLIRSLTDGASEHHLESPRLSDEAAMAFFAGTSANIGPLRRQYKEYYASVSDSLLAEYTRGKMPPLEALESFRKTFCDNAASKNTVLCEETLASIKVLDSKFSPEKFYENPLPPRDLASLGTFGAVKNGNFTHDDLQLVYEMFEVYKKYYSPIAQIPIYTFLDRVETCLKNVPLTKELYGECMLQKILILENVQLPEYEYHSSIDNYLEWFLTLAPTSKDYTKLKEARDILVRMTSKK